MNGIIFVDTVTHVPAVWANAVNTLVYDIFGAATNLVQARARLGLGTMAYQLHNNVNITGGRLNNVTLGVDVPISQLIAQKAQVQDDPVSDLDIVNKGWLRTWVQAALASTQTDWMGGLGTIALQNANNVRIIAGTIENTDIGLLGRASGKFTTLKAANPPIDGDDVVTLGWLTQHYDVRLNAFRSMALQDANAVAIIGGEIDGVRIGQTTPITVRMNRGTVIEAPTNYESIVNKRYVDSSLSASLAGLKTMAFQDSFAVNITGGTINEVAIGLISQAPGAFSNLTVQNNQAWLNLITLSTEVNNTSGIKWFDGGVEVGRLAYYGATNTPQNNLIELLANIPIQLKNDSGSKLRIDGVNTLIVAPKVSINENAVQQLLVGGGVSQNGYSSTFNTPTWFNALAAKRGYFEQGHSDAYDSTYSVTAAGTLTLASNQNSAAFINLTGNANITLAAADSTWLGLRTLKLIIRHAAGGKTVSWPSNVYWGNGVAPDYSHSLSQEFDLVELWTFTGGLTWFASSAYANSVDPQMIIAFTSTN